MKAKGWDYQPVVYTGQQEPFDVAGSIEYRTMHGYVDGSASVPDPHRPPGGIDPASLSKDEYARLANDYNGGSLNDDDSGGCVGQATTALALQVPLTDPAVTHFYIEAAQSVLQSPSMTDARGTWRSCLADHGIIVSDDALDAQGAGTKEAAVADATCFRDNVADVRASAEVAELATFVKRFPQYADLVSNLLEAVGHPLPT